ncbi:MAG: hypothetical protein BRD30_06825, partial [Bacteroidetes bacterium QH_2_63_10]
MHNGSGDESASTGPQMGTPAAKREWWPGSLDLEILDQNVQDVGPWNGDFDYPAAFEQLDFEALKADIEA